MLWSSVICTIAAAFQSTPDDLFNHMRSRSRTAVSPIDGEAARLTFNVGGKAWLVQTLPGEKASVAACAGGCPEEGDVEITIAPDTLTAILERRLSPFAALFQQKLKIVGDGAILRSKSVASLFEHWAIPTEDAGLASGPHAWLRGTLRAVARMIDWATQGPRMVWLETATAVRHGIPRMAVGIRQKLPRFRVPRRMAGHGLRAGGWIVSRAVGGRRPVQ